jgi:O-antigen/teichoic acid export membrane protein
MSNPAPAGMPLETAPTAESHDYRPSFVVNTVWNWMSVAVSLAAALLVPPLLIWRLGDEAYGMWALVFSTVEYYTLLDFGIRSAVVKYVAHDWALGEGEQLNRTLNTAFWYLAFIAATLIVLTIVAAPRTASIFQIEAGMEAAFVYMVFITGVTWAIGMVFLCFSACLEAVQRFDLSNRIQIIANISRTALILVLLQTGFGLPAIVTAAVAARLVQCAMLWRAFKQRFPSFRWDVSAIDRTTFVRLFTFGFHTVPGTLGNLLLLQGPAIVIGRWLPERFVGYYALPWRLLFAGLDLVYRLAYVTNARGSELIARGERAALVRLGVQANRYGLMVFMPAAVFLGVYGDALFRAWLTPQFAAASSPLLLIFLVAAVLADAAQSSSSSMLYALAKHRVYAQALLVESIVSIALLAYFVRRGDLVGGAISTVIAAVINRGVLTPYLLCRALEYPLHRFLREILSWPLTVGAVVGSVLWLFRATWLPGSNMIELAIAAILAALLYVAAAVRYSLFAADQQTVLRLIRQRAPSLERPARVWFGVKAGEAP